ncbi:MAG: [protein-PII] uridylyltransferase [Rhodobacteraceae bacterium]|nr:MAG: [protein-PII] uridylyltransferase [Paracoccaceae bacterium]
MTNITNKKYTNNETFEDRLKTLNLFIDGKIANYHTDVSSDLGFERTIFVSKLKAFYLHGKSLIGSALEINPNFAPKALRYYAQLTDKIIIWTMKNVIKFIHPIANPTKSEKICVVAVGGYGRSEMAPFSDIDLLFITPYKQTAWGESVIESILYILWDLKMKIGYSVRTVDDCLRLGKTDITIRTTLLDHRFLAGEKSLQLTLENTLWKDLFTKSSAEFIEAKLEERANRHLRQGGVRYMLEPNVKEGKGGLRDLQTLYWITKYLYRTSSKEELIKTGVFSKKEFSIFQKAENFLWSVRCNLHIISNRASEQLNFNSQVELARRFGFKDSNGMRGVERFMQAYFIQAKNVGDLTRIFLTVLESKHAKRRPTISGQIKNIFNLGFGRKSDAVLPGSLTVTHGRLNISNIDDFLGQPINLIKLFQSSLKSGLLIHPDALRLIASHIVIIDDNFRKNEEANEIFLDLLLNHNNPEKALRHMNEVGFLGAFIPEFGRIVAMMQFNMYHSFTVDEHTIQCIRTLSEIEHKNLLEDLPIASEILSGDINRRILYVAILLHDIGKGLPEDHSIIGADIAMAVAPRLGLKPEESEIVVWLVKNHLLMSDVAQKRDIADTRTVRDFANQVTSATKLKLLTILTVCDIRGVGPNAWNNWKAVLLRDLYTQTLAFLNEGSMSSSRPERIKSQKNKVRQACPHLAYKEIKYQLDRHYDNFWLGIDFDTQLEFINLLRSNDNDDIKVKIVKDKNRDANRICCVLQDHPGIFARLAGAIALIGANVVDARTYTTRDGLATAVFWVQSSNSVAFENEAVGKIIKSIKSALLGTVVPKRVLDAKGKFSRSEREFKVPTTITFDNLGSDIYTIIEVDTRDRIGLIHDLTSTLYKNNISIFTAIIATYGEQAVDTFYVKDLFGLKLHSKTKQDKILINLRESIEEGAEKAMG